jgi:hypothetical protein
MFAKKMTKEGDSAKKQRREEYFQVKAVFLSENLTKPPCPAFGGVAPRNMKIAQEYS